MRRAVLVVLSLVLLGALAGNVNADSGFEGKRPVYVVICSPVYCGGIWMSKQDAVRAHIPKCSAKVTNWCYR